MVGGRYCHLIPVIPHHIPKLAHRTFTWCVHFRRYHRLGHPQQRPVAYRRSHQHRRSIPVSGHLTQTTQNKCCATLFIFETTLAVSALPFPILARLSEVKDRRVFVGAGFLVLTALLLRIRTLLQKGECQFHTTDSYATQLAGSP